MLQLSQSQRAQIGEHAAARYPSECCGILIGTRSAGRRAVVEVCACENVAPDTLRGYEITASDLIRAQREARMARREIVGFYHSHPNHPAVPSQTDRAQAFWPECSYVILSLTDAELPQARSWLLQNGEFVEETIEVV